MNLVQKREKRYKTIIKQIGLILFQDGVIRFRGNVEVYVHCLSFDDEYRIFKLWEKDSASLTILRKLFLDGLYSMTFFFVLFLYNDAEELERFEAANGLFATV